MGDLNNIIKKTLLIEQKFHEISNEVTFDFDLYHDEWGHTNDRKWRHGSGNKIYDLNIVKLLEEAKDDIVYNIIEGKIREGKRFIVSRLKGDQLNVVIEPKKNYINHWDLTIITVMNKEGFSIGKGQLQIFV
jgi:hypothetical protein